MIISGLWRLESSESKAMEPHTSSQRIYDKEPQNILLQPRILKSYVVETKKTEPAIEFLGLKRLLVPHPNL